MCTGIEQRLLQFLDGRNPVLVTGHDTDTLCRSLVSAGHLVSILEIHLEAPRASATFPAPWVLGDPASIAGSRKSVGRRFDAIAALRLLEHVGDPVRLLTRLGQHLNRDGCVVAAVPNITHGRARLRLLSGQSPLGSFASEATPPTRFYDAASVRRVFERAGFVITQFERCAETFDCDQPTFNGTRLPKEFVAALMEDADALTSTFLVVAHRLPLTGRVLLEIRVRELAQAHQEDRRLLTGSLDTQSVQHAQAQTALGTQRERVDSLDRRQDALSGELDQLKRIVDISPDGVQGASHRRLRNAHEGLMARQTDLEAIRRQLQRLQYEQSIDRIRTLVDASLPKTAVVLVVSKGDARLLELHGRTGWHFLQNDAGVYAGHHPVDSAAAIEALERLRAKGADYLLFPWSMFWWLDHYAALKEYLNQRCRVVLRDDRSCVIYRLAGSQGQ